MLQLITHNMHGMDMCHFFNHSDHRSTSHTHSSYAFAHCKGLLKQCTALNPTMPVGLFVRKGGGGAWQWAREAVTQMTVETV